MSQTKNVLTIEDLQSFVRTVFDDSAHFVFLLGSFGTPRFRPESDVDLAVFFKNDPSHENLMEYLSKLENALGRDCDLLKLNAVDPIYARQVLDTGRELFVKDRSSLNLWKADQFSRYPDFKRSRKVIEDNLLNRKRYV